MRRININKGWLFTKEGVRGEAVDLPHTWNAFDGQDGGNDYYRGECEYKRNICVDFIPGERVYLECEAANSIARVVVNGKEAGIHKGGYSRFRFDITDYLESGEEAELEIYADNSHYEDVYPLMADFTFFGGLYRDVNLVIAGASRFSLDDFGSDGVYISQKQVNDKSALLGIEARLTLPKGLAHTVRVVLFDSDRNPVATAETEAVPGAEAVELDISLKDPVLWDGVSNPYMYEAELRLLAGGVEKDIRRIPVGLRYFEFSAGKGLLLNGKPLDLRGVSRHQCRKDKGWAVSYRDMEEDIRLILEMGANSIRLAHYQHHRRFYELCDRAGIITWAEIPYISMSSSEDFTGANAKSQMTELVKQNYNNPSILIWGVQNELTIGGKDNNLEEIVTELTTLTRELDPYRVTAQAQVGHHPDDDSMNMITDIIGYNKYYGWYYDTTEDMGKWLDKFHSEQPDIPIGITEYGCEAVVSYHNDEPKRSDYSEEYQTWYHHQMIKTWNTRPWIWGTYVWNMFDFASDLRDEGGVKGMNNKGLVTHDRSIKKDSFYIYKSYWSAEPVLHIASRRFKNRLKGRTEIKVITNLPEVSLYLNGKYLVSVSADENLACFRNVKLKKGENTVLVKAKSFVSAGQTGVELPESVNEVYDACIINGITSPDPAYICKQTESAMDTVANWFDDNSDEPAGPMEFPEGMYSVRDKIKEILKSEEAEAVLRKYMAPMFEHSMFSMIKGFSLEKLAGMQPDYISESFLAKINAELTKIKK